VSYHLVTTTTTTTTTTTMRVLVLGATGFIGFPVAQALVRCGHEVIGTSRDPKAKEMFEKEEGERVLW